MKGSSEKRKGAIIYTRVSTGEQAENGTSLGSQFDACTKKAAALGIPVVAVYEDAGISGSFLTARSGMMQAVADIQEGLADTLICATFDRLSREEEHQHRLKREVRSAGGIIVFCDMQFDDTPEGELNFTIQGGFKAYERKVIRKRTMDGKRRFAEAGVQPARSTPPYGYHIVTRADVIRGSHAASELGRYLVVEDHAAVVKEIFERYGTTQESMMSICRDLNGRGIQPPGRGKRWHESGLSCIVRNTAYIGEAVFGKTVHRRDENRLRAINPRTGMPMTCVDYKLPADEQNWTIISCPTLVSAQLWSAVQEKLATHPSRSGNPRQVRMLSGRIYCAECGSRMTLSSTPNRNYKREGVYYCGSKRDREKFVGTLATVCSCGPQGHKRPAVEQAVVLALQTAVQRPDIIQAALRAYRTQLAVARKPEDADRKLAEIDRQLEAIGAEEARTVQAQIAGMAAGASPDVYAAIFKEIAARRKKFEQQRADLAQRVKASMVSTTNSTTAATPSATSVLADIGEALASEEISDSEKRDLLSRVVDRVRCRGANGDYPGGVDVLFLPGLFGEGFSDGEACGDSILQPTTMDRRVSQPSTSTRMTCGITKAAKYHISQKCQMRARS
jgi:DNA invertase Pin-like site-specific DNA recombinase